MYRDELSKASAGNFGFSQMLYDYLSQKKWVIYEIYLHFFY
jgi:hypothetical protein